MVLRIRTEWRRACRPAFCIPLRLSVKAEAETILPARPGDGEGGRHGRFAGTGEECPLEKNSGRLPRATLDMSPAEAIAATTRGQPDDARTARAKPHERAALQAAQGSGRALAGTTYLLGAGEPGGDPASGASLQVGVRLLLRRRPQTVRPEGVARSRVEARAPDGRLVGQLPPDDADAVAELLDAGVLATARVAALVPAFGRQRVQLAIEVERMAGDAGPAGPAAKQAIARGGP